MTWPKMQLFSIAIVVFLAFFKKAKAFDLPPRISTPFNDNYYIPENNIKIKEWQCNASGSPPIRYEWKKDGVTLTSSNYVVVDETTGKLSILMSRYPSDFGKYQCFAHNGVGTAMSASFNLKKSFVGPFSDTMQKTLDTVDQYTRVSLKCTDRPSCVPNNQCKLQWKKGEEDPVQEDKRIAIDKDGTLHFLSVRVDDQSTLNTPYSCVIGNEEMKAYFEGPNIIMPVRNDITWKVNGLEISPTLGKYEFDDPWIRRRLKIRELTFRDEMLYTCIAMNRHGYANTHLFLNVTAKPFFKTGETLTSVVMTTGKNATFTCKMYSAPMEQPPTAPQWFRNGIPIHECDIGPNPGQKYLLSPDKSVLTIKNVQNEPAPGDNSVITCKAGNVITNSNEEDIFSETYADATLVVTDDAR